MRFMSIIMIMIIVVSNSMVVCGVRRNIIFINITCVSVALVSVANTGHGVAVRGSYKYDNKKESETWSIVVNIVADVVRGFLTFLS